MDPSINPNPCITYLHLRVYAHLPKSFCLDNGIFYIKKLCNSRLDIIVLLFFRFEKAPIQFYKYKFPMISMKSISGLLTSRSKTFFLKRYKTTVPLLKLSETEPYNQVGFG
jgi:hypothetical protein